MIIPENLQELKTVPQWVNYVRIWNDTKHGGTGGYDKPPVNPFTLRDAATTRPTNWTTYDRAADNIGKTAQHRDTKHRGADGVAPIVEADIEGTGFVFANGFCGVDFDDVLDDDGNIVPEFALELVSQLDTYTETSPSGSGLHSLLYVEDFEDGDNFGAQFLFDENGSLITEEEDKRFELEIYFYKNGGRYFTITGNAFHDVPIRRIKYTEFREIYDEYIDKREEYRRSQIDPAVETHYTRSGTVTAEDTRKMIDDALPAIDPGDLDFGEWVSIMTALKVSGYSLSEAEAFSSGSLHGSPNPKNDSRTNSKRWNKFSFKRGDEGAAGIIVNAAKRYGWTPAQAFDEEDRAAYGRSLYTEEERREYGRKLHTEEERREYGRKKYEEALDELFNQHGGREEFVEQWKDRRNVKTDDNKQSESPQPPTDPGALPGLLTFDAAVETFLKADNSFLNLKSFPNFSKAAKIHTHDTVALSADTGAGKSSLALNFINDLNDEYPVIYFNLEMDEITILRRLVAIRSGVELDRIEGYQQDEQTAAVVNSVLKALTSRQPLQIMKDVYDLYAIEAAIQQATTGRENPTIVIIDHSLLVTTDKKNSSRLERFTDISETLRRISKKYNIIMFILLQQNRSGKDDENKRPKNSSLKETGSWENDSTHVMFLWYDPEIQRKRLFLTKNRNGGSEAGDVVLDYFAKTQTYREARTQPTTVTSRTSRSAKARQTKDDRNREKLVTAYDTAMIETNGRPALDDIATAAGETSRTVEAWVNKYGGSVVDGFVRLATSEAEEVEALFS